MNLTAGLVSLVVAFTLSMPSSVSAPANSGHEGSPLAPPPLRAFAGQGAPATKSSRDHRPASLGTIHVTTTLVEVSVVVRDKHGEPVRDLKQDNFELYDEGKQQKIQLFALPPTGPSAAFGGPATPTSSAPSSADFHSPAHIYSNRDPGAPERSSVTVILIDPMDLWCTEWPRARDQIIQFLRQVSPGDRIGIYLMTWSGISILHDITQDSSALIKQLASWNGQFEQHRRPCSALEPLSTTYVGGDFSFLLNGPSPMQVATGFGNSYNRNFLGAGNFNPSTMPTIRKLKLFEAIAHHLAAVPGRKNLLWLSDGFPISGFTEGPTGQAEAYSYGREEEEAMRVMNQANIAIYGFDVGGLRAFGDPLSPSLPPNPKAIIARSADEPPDVDLHTHQEFMSGLMTTQLAIEEISDDTGGRAYLNTNDLTRVIRNVCDDSRTTYTLGFYPERPRFGGEFHRLQVKVKGRPDARLNYRKGYLDAPGAGDIESDLQGAAWSPLDASGIGVTAAMTPRKADYDLSVTIALDGLSLESDGKTWKGAIHVVLVQKDDQGGRYNSVDQTVNLALRPETYRKMLERGFGFHERFAMHPRATSLRVIVLDETSGNVGSLTIPVASSN